MEEETSYEMRTKEDINIFKNVTIEHLECFENMKNTLPEKIFFKRIDWGKIQLVGFLNKNKYYIAIKDGKDTLGRAYCLKNEYNKVMFIGGIEWVLLLNRDINKFRVKLNLEDNKSENLYKSLIHMMF
jgi:hypothetical protein